MLNRNTKRGCVLLTTCAAALISTGCRSMPGANMFGWRGEPSAEALAGSGPTTTYPAPPSASATPEAIASIAGGTSAPSTSSGRGSGTAQVAGFDVSPGYATPASNVSSTNMAAAQANGIYSGTKSAGFTAPPVPKTTPSEYKPSGYAFGSKATTPKPESSPISTAAISPASSTVPSSPSSYAKASSYTPPASSFAPPASGFSPPATSSFTAPPSTGSSGYTLPVDSPAVAAITRPAASQSAASTAEESANAFAPPAAAAPEFSTASTSSAITAPITSTDDTSTDDSSESSGSGYTPGSTGNSSGYPSGSVTPTTTGSFYR